MCTGVMSGRVYNKNKNIFKNEQRSRDAAAKNELMQVEFSSDM